MSCCGTDGPVITVYGLSNCDTCRKARRWLTDQGLQHRFHDVRTDGLDPVRVLEWLKSLGWENVVNRRSSTWRSLGPAERDGLDTQRAARLILDHPVLIKRPLIDVDGQMGIGFDPERLTALTGV